MKTVLTIQSQVAGARVGNSVAAFAFERLGVRALCLPTTLLGRRPDRGSAGGGPVSASQLSSMLDALEADGALARVDLVLSGYLGEAAHAELVRDAVRRVKSANPSATYVCDPVLGDTESGQYVRGDIADAISQALVPAADLITPNIWELGRLTGVPVHNAASAVRVARSLCRAAVVTSIPSPHGIGALYCDAHDAWVVETPRAPGAAKGAGDLFTALFLAHRLGGRAAPEALERAAGATYDVIARDADDLAVIESQDNLGDPDTQPKAKRLSE
jgi:pyridoxine kinase